MAGLGIIDMIGITRHWNRVVRFLVILLTSLSLLLSPAMAAAVIVGSGAAQVECSMSEAEMDMSTGADHDKMDCCTPQCTAPAAAAVLASNDPGSDISPEAGSPLLSPPDAMLPSVNPAATEPPPRLI